MDIAFFFKLSVKHLPKLKSTPFTSEFISSDEEKKNTYDLLSSNFKVSLEKLWFDAHLYPYASRG